VIGLLIAVLVASVLGSMHCVGMCGPLALWASGAGSERRGSVWLRLSAYHLGRLLTYTVAGALAGSVGALVSAGGSMVGIQSAAARIVGGAMIALGIVRLAEWLLPGVMRGRQSAGEGAAGGRIARWISQARPTISRFPVLARGFAAGSLTTLLPCGWLYLFVLVAAGTGHPLSAVAVMWAFWLGTVPALTALVAGAWRLAPQLGRAVPVLGAALLLATGFYTATGRAAADLAPLADRAAALRDGQQDGAAAGDAQSATRTLQALSDEPLPCCEDAD
jgi:hypothetical protein